MKVLDKISDHLNRIPREICSGQELLIPDFFNIDHKSDDIEKYVIWIVDSLLKSDNELAFCNVVIPDIVDEQKESILLGLILFFVVKTIDSVDIEDVKDDLRKVRQLIQRGIRDTEGLKGSSRKFKKLQAEYKQRKGQEKFYQALINWKEQRLMHEKKIETYSTLFNLLKREKGVIAELLPNHKILYQEIENLKFYDNRTDPIVILNNANSLNDLDKISDKIDLFDIVGNIVLFGVENRHCFKSFNFRSIDELNRQEDTRFENLMLVSFVKNYSLNRALNKVQMINADFYFRTKGFDFNAYVIHPLEVQNNELEKYLPVQMVEGTNDLYNVFISQISEHEDLIELLSIKMRNLYSLCYSLELKEYIIEGIFSSNSTLIQEETNIALMSMRDSEKNQLKTTLGMILDSFLISDFNLKLFKLIESKYKEVLIPFHAWKDNTFKDLLSNVLGNEVYFYTWKTIFEHESSSVLILDYRDTGGFPFRIAPNIHEFPINEYPGSISLYRFDLFGRNYQYTLVEYWGTTLKYLLNNKLRYENFELDSIIKELEEIRPEKQEIFDLYDIENNYSREYDSRSFRIEIEGGRAKKYIQSDQFIVEQENEYFVLRADDLLEEIENLTSPKIQLLENIYLGLNLFESTQAEKEEILELKRKYNLNQDDIENRLWKVVLKRKADLEGWETIYNLLLESCNEKGGSMVSKSHFEHDWLNPSSSSVIPRSKKTFLSLVELLNLPIAYYRVMLKQRAKMKFETRKSSSKMNALIIDLVENGLFNQGDVSVEVLESIASRHPLEEIGVMEENYREELTALVSLIKENIKTHRLININEE